MDNILSRPPTYGYSTLPENHIRISTILPGSGDAPLRIRLHTYNMNDLPSYDALSYCWGDGATEKECVCEDDEASSGNLMLSENLWCALTQLRRAKETTWLWADQLCIDQRNLEEKACQIRLMGQVYSRASEVIVWLGVADAETALAFNLIEDVWKQIVNLLERDNNLSVGENLLREYHRVTISSADSPEWLAFRRLFRRPWFSRLWVFQEVALSRWLRIVCGEFSVSLKQLIAVCRKVNALDSGLRNQSAHIRGKDTHLSFMNACNRTRKWHNATRPRREASGCLELLNLIKMCMAQTASVPHDYVYALMGVAEDVDPSMVPVSYLRPFRDLFVYITKFFVARYSDLSALSLVAPGTSRKLAVPGPRLLPSWVPDYRYPVSRINPRGKIIGHDLDRPYDATGLSRASAVPEFAKRLSVNGICVGTIQVLSKPDGNVKDGKSIGDRVVTGGQWSQIADSCAPDGVYGPTGEHISQAYARLRVADYLPGEKDAPRRSARTTPLSGISEPSPSYMFTSPNGERLIKSDAGDRMTTHILLATTKQRLFLTDTGYMGLCHKSCVLGGQVWLLMGGDMPFILRKLGTEPITYEFKGESYVHGIMDGEYLLQHFKGGNMLSDKEWLKSLANGLPFQTKALVLS